MEAMSKQRGSARAAASSKQKKPSVQKKRPAAQKKGTYGWSMTAALFAVLFLMIICLWALFISGPSRLYDEQVAQVQARIEEQVPHVEGLTENKFDFVTWQGYTDQKLYWFDAQGGIITERDLSTLNYEAAREKARSSYDMDPETVTLAYGYSAPVYQLQSGEQILMLDYDTLDWVYERNLVHAQP